MIWKLSELFVQKIKQSEKHGKRKYMLRSCRNSFNFIRKSYSNVTFLYPNLRIFSISFYLFQISTESFKVISKFSNDDILILYGWYMRYTVGDKYEISCVTFYSKQLVLMPRLFTIYITQTEFMIFSIFSIKTRTVAIFY